MWCCERMRDCAACCLHTYIQGCRKLPSGLLLQLQFLVAVRLDVAMPCSLIVSVLAFG